MTVPGFRDAITNALRFWERSRIVYNLVLLAVVAICFVLAPAGGTRQSGIDLFLQLFLLAMVANVLFCAAYVVDIAMQFSGYRDAWLRRRWLLLILGTLFAATIAQFISRGMSGWPPHG